MQPDPFSDERDIDAVLRGRTPAESPELEPFVAFVADVRAVGLATPRPNAELAALLASGLAPVPPAGAIVGSHARTQAPAVRWARRSAPAVRWFGSMRTAAKAGALAAVAVLSLTTAAAAGALPDPVQDKMSTAVETVTPWSVPRPAGRGIGKDVREKARKHGQDKNGNNGNGQGKKAGTTKPGNSAGTGAANGKPDKEQPDNGKPDKVKPAKVKQNGTSGGPDASAQPSKQPRPSKKPQPAKASKPAKPAKSAKPAVLNPPAKPSKTATPTTAAKPTPAARPAPSAKSPRPVEPANTQKAANPNKPAVKPTKPAASR